ncbi:MAG: hypothetical protein R3264_23280 [Anaerolineae bacterium]|nr:hypothetical protein [Anaerolineae bacterium]
MSETIDRLRAALTDLRDRLIEAEADLADRLAEINVFELEFEARVGHLIDQLDGLTQEIQRYNDRIQMARNKQIFGNAYLSVETQYRRTWQAPPHSAPIPPPDPLPADNEAEIKQLYRQLARRFHPDLAVDDKDRLYRTEKMAAVNDAYAARSLIELVALLNEAETIITPKSANRQQSEAQLRQALEAELARCQRRLKTIEAEVRNLSHRPSVQVSLEVKAAKRQGRDLLAEMAAEIEQRIARQQVERDMLKAQFDQLGPDQGFIRIER